MRRNRRSGAAGGTPRGWRRVTAYVALAVVGGSIVLPLLWAVRTSLQPLEEAFRYPLSWRMSDPRWANYAEVWRTLPLGRFLLNSLLISTVSAVGAVLTSAMAGYAFARLPWRGKRWWFGVLLGSLVVPSQVLLVPHFLLFEALGWVGTYKPLIVPAWLGGGAFNVLLFYHFFRRVPAELIEAATLDGASTWQTFLRIMLPAARPAVVTAGVLSFVYHWKDFFRPLIYLADFHTYPIALGLRMYQTATGSWVNLLMAASVIALVPPAVLFLVSQRSLTRGLSADLDR